MKTIVLGMLFMILMLPLVNAQQTAPDDPGITPDSFLWGLDRALDQLSLLLTFDKGAKARKGLEIAQERLLEVKSMIKENKLEAAKKAEAAHGEVLSEVERNIKTLKEDDSTEEIQNVIAIEKDLEAHDQAVEQTFGELNIKIEIKGETAQGQKELIDAILNSLKGQTGKVEITIKNKKNEIKVKIHRETGKPEEEIESEIGDMEDEQGIEKDEKALEAIQDAEKERDAFLRKAGKKNMTIPQNLMSQFDALLEDAKAQFGQGNFTEAKKMAEQAEKLLDKEGDEELRKEREIEVEAEEGNAKIDIKINGEKLKFRMNTTDQDMIISEIADRTGLSKSEVSGIMKGENGREQENAFKQETNDEAEEENESDDQFVENDEMKEQVEEKSRKQPGKGMEKMRGRVRGRG